MAVATVLASLPALIRLEHHPFHLAVTRWTLCARVALPIDRTDQSQFWSYLLAILWLLLCDFYPILFLSRSGRIATLAPSNFRQETLQFTICRVLSH